MDSGPTRGTATLDEYAAEVQRVWHWDKQRPVLIAWLIVAAHASELCEEVRKAAWGKIAKQLAEVVVWWLSFAKRVTTLPTADNQQDLITYIQSRPSDIVWFKYPRVCPVCFSRLLIRLGRLNNDEVMPQSAVVIDDALFATITAHFDTNKQCTCLAAKDEVENRTDAQKKNAKQFLRVYAHRQSAIKPASMRELSEMLKAIFENNTAALTMEEIAFHLLEEVGEVAEALNELHRAFRSKSPAERRLERQKRIAGLAEELADVFSWCNCLLAKLSRYLHGTVDYLRDTKEKDFAAAVDAVLGATDNLESLIWRQFGKDNHLCCEGCGERICTGKPKQHNGKAAATLGELDETLIELLTTHSALLPDA